MIEINSTTLKYAFKKLKTYYYYYHSSNYLKAKIIEFEESLKRNKTSFDSLSRKLNNLLNDPLNHLSNYFSYGYKMYPKKNAFVNYRGEAQINTDKTNYFVNLEIPLYLVDILFCLEIIESQGENVNSDYSFGGIVDSRIFKSKDLVSNKFLFEDYKKGYQKWLNLPLKDSANGDKTITVVRTDIKSCFYNVKFNFNLLLDRLNITGSECSTVMKQVYNLYTASISNKAHDVTKEFRMVVLPIGLLSAQLILNYLLKDVDDRIVKSNKHLSYGRYVDDIIIVLNEDYSEDFSVEELLTSVFPDVFTKNDGFLKINKTRMLSKDLDLNMEKTYFKPLKSFSNNGEEMQMFEDVSFCDFYDYERENSPSFFFKDYSSIDVRNLLYDTLYEGSDKAFTAIMNCDYATILNCFSFWADILNKFKNKVGLYCEIIKKIEKSIECVRAINNGVICYGDTSLITETLIEELSVSKMLISEPQHNCYFGSISQEDILSLIDKTLQNEYEFAPMIFSVAEISFYLANQNEFDYKKHIDKTINYYQQLNEIIDTSGFDINRFELTIDNRICRLSRKNKRLRTKEDSDIVVALGALNMDQLEQYDVTFHTPPGYTIDDIFRIIKTASSEKAQYLLLPEFALDYNWILSVVRECRKRKISLISGIIHYPLPSGEVANITLIYEHFSGIVFLKPKNYMSPDEKSLITYNKPQGMGLKYFEPNNKYYFIINDGCICYSTMTCYEATNIVDRALFADQINVLFMPVFNYDTDYFSNIINSLSRDISCFVLQANSNSMGDTKIRMPTYHFLADLVVVKGGSNNYCIVEKINVSELHKGNNDYFADLKKANSGTLEPKLKRRDRKIKKLSAGNHCFKP